MPPDIEQEIQALQDMTTTELAEHYAELHGHPSSARMSSLWMAGQHARGLIHLNQASSSASQLPYRSGIALLRGGTSPN